MADQTITDYALKGLTVAGGGSALTLLIYGLGQLLRGWQSGAGVQEKELRGGLAERVATLEERLEKIEKRLDAVTRERDGWRSRALWAQFVADSLAAKHGEPPPVWPPPEPPSPSGGTP